MVFCLMKDRKYIQLHGVVLQEVDCTIVWAMRGLVTGFSCSKGVLELKMFLRNVSRDVEIEAPNGSQGELQTGLL